jgi:hypothetical protein
MSSLERAGMSVAWPQRREQEGRRRSRDKGEALGDEDGSAARFFTRRRRPSRVHVCACGWTREDTERERGVLGH